MIARALRTHWNETHMRTYRIAPDMAVVEYQIGGNGIYWYREARVLTEVEGTLHFLLLRCIYVRNCRILQF